MVMFAVVIKGIYCLLVVKLGRVVYQFCAYQANITSLLIEHHQLMAQVGPKVAGNLLLYDYH